MRFLHLSDLHIGLKLINRDMGEDQKYILGEIVKAAAAERPDAVVIAGDIYDRSVPSSDALELFDRFITGLSAAVPEAEIMLISGNHDSPQRVNLFRNLLQRQRVHMVGLPPMRRTDHIEKVVCRDEFGPVNFYLLPFVKPSMVRQLFSEEAEEREEQEGERALTYNEAVRRLILREEINPAERNVLVSHQFYCPKGESADQVERMESEIRTVGNIDEVSSEILGVFDYAALGHLHKPLRVGSEFYRYCGTPLACSVSEAGQKKGVILAELLEKGTVKTRVIPLTPLREIRVLRGRLTEVLLQASEDYVEVILTDGADLDVLDMQDRLRQAFPNLLSIRREIPGAGAYREEADPEEEADPLSLLGSFLGGLSEEEQELLKDVVNTVNSGA